MKASKKLLVTGIIACVVGFAGLAPSAYFWYQNRQLAKVAAQSGGPAITVPTVVEAPRVITGKPSRLQIPSLGLDLAVADGIYNPENGQWSLSMDKVHYALMTVQPNDKQGNTLIYGHRMANGTIFAQLPEIKPGASVSLTTTNGYVFTYKFTGSKVIEPTDTSILNYEGKPRLTLQTCTGVFMQDRQLFVFEFIDIKKGK